MAFEKPSLYHQSARLLNNSTFIVSIIVSLRLVQIVFTSSSHGRYKELPSMNIIFMRMSFFSLFVSFVFMHSLVCPITHSFLDGFQPNLVQHFPQVCSICHTIFSLKKTLECVCERLLHCRLISAITWIPGK